MSLDSDLTACREERIDAPSGATIHALINGAVGWLMFLRFPDDAGFSSRNPQAEAGDDETIQYLLANGQVDRYPAAWAIPVCTVELALDYFRREGKQPPFIAWHDDSTGTWHGRLQT